MSDDRTHDPAEVAAALRWALEILVTTRCDCYPDPRDHELGCRAAVSAQEEL